MTKIDLLSWFLWLRVRRQGANYRLDSWVQILVFGGERHSSFPAGAKTQLLGCGHALASTLDPDCILARSQHNLERASLVGGHESPDAAAHSDNLQGLKERLPRRAASRLGWCSGP